jgi:hypothetical protein
MKIMWSSSIIGSYILHTNVMCCKHVWHMDKCVDKWNMNLWIRDVKTNTMWSLCIKCHVDVHLGVSIVFVRTNTRNFSLKFKQPLLQMAIENGFWLLILWWLKTFDRQPYNDQNIFSCPSKRGDWKISTPIKGGHVLWFWKGFIWFKKFGHHWIMAIEIFQSPKKTCEGWFFLYNDITWPPPPPFVIEIFQSPFNKPPSLDGNQKGWWHMLSFWEKKKSSNVLPLSRSNNFSHHLIHP